MPDQAMRPKRRVIALAVVVGVVLGIVGLAATNSMVHWSGSNEFCSTACHSMQWVAEAYRRGPHYATPSGAAAGCSDCHSPHHSSEPSPFQYVGMLFYKAKAGTRDAIAEMRGVIDTQEKWEKARGAYSEEVSAWMAENDSLTCRGCHDLSRMGGEDAKPRIIKKHAKLLAEGGPIKCLECHMEVGHVYEVADADVPAAEAAPPAEEMPPATEATPPIDGAAENP